MTVATALTLLMVFLVAAAAAAVYATAYFRAAAVEPLIYTRSSAWINSTTRIVAFTLMGSYSCVGVVGEYVQLLARNHSVTVYAVVTRGGEATLICNGSFVVRG